MASFPRDQRSFPPELHQEPLLGDKAEPQKIGQDTLERVQRTMQAHKGNIKILEENMQKLGLQQEYKAFRDRYFAWRKGEAAGARGELIDERKPCGTFGDKGLENKRNLAANRGFGFWYPTVQEWLWKRTMSYWIAVTFLEGSFFFFFSSFCYNAIEDDGTPVWDEGTFKAVTMFGYIGGKVNFFVCTYLMCLETVNFSAGHADGSSSSPVRSRGTSADTSASRRPSVTSLEPAGSPPRTNPEETSLDSASENASPDKGYYAVQANPEEAVLRRRLSSSSPKAEVEPFFLNPFRVWTAQRRLKSAGLTVWPYVTALVYFVGVLLFTVGMACEFLPGGIWRRAGAAVGYRNLECCWTGCSGCVLMSAKRYAFILGALCFLSGGVVECRQNYRNITSKSCSSRLGFIVGFLNALGGAFYTAGSITLNEYQGNSLFGVGSVIFIGASSIQIWMWKDEQFGLSFLAGLNDSHTLALLPRNDRSRFSWRGVIFVWLYCYCGAVSVYNFAIEVGKHFSLTNLRWDQMAFNELLPFIFAHMMLMLTSAVVRVPPGRPYRQMYICLRALSIALALNSTLTLSEFLFKLIKA